MGRENYRESYEKAEKELKEAFKEAKGCCFDHLRLDRGYQAQFPGDVGGAFRLQPAFHVDRAFWYYRALAEVTIPERFRERGGDIFPGCENLNL